MKKIPTIFIRNPEAMRFVTEEWHPDCLWVRDREGKPTVKRDGTACLIRNNKLYKRYELKPGKAPPPSLNRPRTQTRIPASSLAGCLSAKGLRISGTERLILEARLTGPMS